MKQIYKLDGPYKDESGVMFDAKCIDSAERPPKGWTTDFDKMIKGAKKSAPASAPAPEPATIPAEEVQAEA
jgi:hypothetical protein